MSIYVNTQGTNTIDEAKIEAAIPEIMNLSPKGIREKLQLNKAIYEQTAPTVISEENMTVGQGHFLGKP